jgi:hypothetical protein
MAASFLCNSSNSHNHPSLTTVLHSKPTAISFKPMPYHHQFTPSREQPVSSSFASFQSQPIAALSAKFKTKFQIHKSQICNEKKKGQRNKTEKMQIGKKRSIAIPKAASVAVAASSQPLNPRPRHHP